MAGNLIVLRRRIKSVKNTQKLTRAMKTVAAAKLRRATTELKKSRPYRDKIASFLRQAAAGADLEAQPLLRQPEQGAVLLVVVAGDKGLCGAFNSHVLKKSEARYRELTASGQTVSLITVGSKASRYFSKKGIEVEKAHNGVISRLQFADADNLAAELQELCLNGGIKSVEFAFNEFVSASRQQFSIRPLFPVVLEPPAAGADAGKDADAARVETILEPGAAALIRSLLPRHISALVYQILLQSMAAEQMARMVAMDLATRNASDMIRALTLLLNKMRQAAITKELLEIITATEALNK
ncbi:MAG TPA: ATP synthase F1 subunit gamma [Patescibacteria group bacterium]|nr:ATP synthase F1 subunit gamma [Patescibacteria group bacterium]